MWCGVFWLLLLLRRSKLTTCGRYRDHITWNLSSWYICRTCLQPSPANPLCKPLISLAWQTKIAQSRSPAISAFTEPNRQNSHGKHGFSAWRPQREIANRLQFSIAPLDYDNAALPCLANSGVCDGHRNCKSQKWLRFRCAKRFRLDTHTPPRHWCTK